MFNEAPFLSLLIFGFPFGIISVVFYFLCCMDSNDQQDSGELTDSDQEDDHQFFLNEASRLHEKIKALNSKLILF